MRIIISPAKKMREDGDSLPPCHLPDFLAQSEELLGILRTMDVQALKKLWGCSDKLVELNRKRLEVMEPRKAQTPAILAYEGIQYQYMAPGVFSREALEYVEEHLRILSGFYGVLRPFDAVAPYRLEMQAKLKTRAGNDLYSFWDSMISDHIYSETNCVINLASQEYSVCLSRHLPANCRLITCMFTERKGEKLIEKGTFCKMARGEMVRFLAEHRIVEPEGVKAFSELGYHFSESDSDDNTYVFIKEEL